VGFFTDAYDLFVIGIASALITKDWNLSPGQLALLNSTMLAAALLGAMVFGRYETLDEDAACVGVGAMRQGVIGRGIRRRRVHHVGVAPGAATRIAASFFAHDL
jgi:MFS family permease